MDVAIPVVGLLLLSLCARRDKDRMPSTSGMGEDGIRKTAGARMGRVDRFIEVDEDEAGTDGKSSELPGSKSSEVSIDRGACQTV